MSTQERTEVRTRDGWTNGSSAGVRPVADRLPRPPGRRRPGLAVVAVLLIVLGAAVAGLLALRLDTRVPVLVARHEIGAGQKIERSDLSIARIAAEGVSVIPAEQASTVINTYTNQRVPAGRLLDASMLSAIGLLTPGQAAVGVALPPGRLPAKGLATGDIVQVVRTTSDGTGRVIAPRAVVSSTVTPEDGSFGSGGSSTLVTVIVSDRVSPTIAAASHADQVSLVLLERGTTAKAG